MKIVKPKVFLVGETRIIPGELNRFLRHIGAPDWSTDAPSHSEKLAEVMGRVCYNSFRPGLNPNVTKVRQGNKQYLGHIIETSHGSVLEHATVNFILADISRVLTHELVRHRVGVAISQQSLRYVRLHKIRASIPIIIRENEEAMEVFVSSLKRAEEIQKELTRLLGVAKSKDFTYKKKATSAMRRVAPMGLATVIGWSTNLRTLRFVIEKRTDPAAEEEIRMVFAEVAKIAMERYPNVFGDFEKKVVDGIPWYKPKFSKV